jgi:hypothetical protein
MARVLRMSKDAIGEDGMGKNGMNNDGMGDDDGISWSHGDILGKEGMIYLL